MDAKNWRTVRRHRFRTSFIASITAKYGEIKHAIQNIMKDHDISPECYLMCRNKGNYTSPKSFSNYFEKRTNMKEFSKFSIIILTMEVDVAFLYQKRELLLSKASKQLQPLIKRCSDLMNLKLSAEITTICRRVIVSCFNGGIPIDLLSELRSKLDVDIDLPNLNIFIPDLAREAVELAEMNEFRRILRHPISNFYNHLY